MPRDTGIANRLRAKGLKVVEVNGWQTRGSSDFVPRGSVDHHTAGSSRGNVPSLSICINGRTGLVGPLCNVLIARDNTCYVIAAGRANHAGAGGWGGLIGNSSVFGVERENVGDGSEPWTLQQYDVAAKVHAALISMHGGRFDLVCEHKEWAPRRKVDAFGVDGNIMRQLVRDRLSVKPTAPTTPSTAPNLKPLISASQFLSEVHKAAISRPTLKQGSTGTWVKDLQEALNHIVGKKVLNADGVFNAETVKWVKQFQKDRSLPSDGVVGVKTWEQVIAARMTVKH